MKFKSLINIANRTIWPTTADPGFHYTTVGEVQTKLESLENTITQGFYATTPQAREAFLQYKNFVRGMMSQISRESKISEAHLNKARR